MLRIAFATSDRSSVDQHFGAAVAFAIYAIDAEHSHLVEVVEFADDAPAASAAAGSEAAACGGGTTHNEDKLGEKIAALSGCAAVYCLAVGGSAVRRLLAEGIQPVRVEADPAIAPVLRELCAAVRDGGIPWLDKHLKRNADSHRFERMAEEGWVE